MWLISGLCPGLLNKEDKIVSLMPQEMERWKRQIALPGFGVDGQSKLQASRVAVFGVGGVGSATALYLAAAGVRNLILVDKDTVSLDNLHRQVIYCQDDIGQPKAAIAARRLRAIDSELNIQVVGKNVNLTDIREIVTNCSMVVDAFDRIGSRLDINQACVEQNIPAVHGFAQEFGGEAILVKPFDTACLECILDRDTYEPVDNPILGVSAGFIGIYLAGITIKYLTGCGEIQAGQRLFWDFFLDQFICFPLVRKVDCVICNRM